MMDSFLSPSSISSLPEIECTPDYIKLDGKYFYSDRFYLNDLNRYQDLEDIQIACQSSDKENKNDEESGPFFNRSLLVNALASTNQLKACIFSTYSFSLPYFLREYRELDRKKVPTLILHGDQYIGRTRSTQNKKRDTKEAEAFTQDTLHNKNAKKFESDLLESSRKRPRLKNMSTKFKKNEDEREEPNYQIDEDFYTVTKTQTDSNYFGEKSTTVTSSIFPSHESPIKEGKEDFLMPEEPYVYHNKEIEKILDMGVNGLEGKRIRWIVDRVPEHIQVEQCLPYYHISELKKAKTFKQVEEENEIADVYDENSILLCDSPREKFKRSMGVHHPKYILLFTHNFGLITVVSTGNLTPHETTLDASWCQAFPSLNVDKSHFKYHRKNNDFGFILEDMLKEEGKSMQMFRQVYDYEKTRISGKDQYSTHICRSINTNTPLRWLFRTLQINVPGSSLYNDKSKIRKFRQLFDFSIAKVSLVTTTPILHQPQSFNCRRNFNKQENEKLFHGKFNNKGVEDFINSEKKSALCLKDNKTDLNCSIDAFTRKIQYGQKRIYQIQRHRRPEKAVIPEPLDLAVDERVSDQRYTIEVHCKKEVVAGVTPIRKGPIYIQQTSFGAQISPSFMLDLFSNYQGMESLSLSDIRSIKLNFIWPSLTYMRSMGKFTSKSEYIIDDGDGGLFLNPQTYKEFAIDCFGSLPWGNYHIEDLESFNNQPAGDVEAESCDWFKVFQPRERILPSRKKNFRPQSKQSCYGKVSKENQTRFLNEFSLCLSRIQELTFVAMASSTTRKGIPRFEVKESLSPNIESNYIEHKKPKSESMLSDNFENKSFEIPSDEYIMQVQGRVNDCIEQISFHASRLLPEDLEDLDLNLKEKFIHESINHDESCIEELVDSKHLLPHTKLYFQTFSVDEDQRLKSGTGISWLVLTSACFSNGAQGYYTDMSFDYHYRSKEDNSKDFDKSFSTRNFEMGVFFSSTFKTFGEKSSEGKTQFDSIYYVQNSVNEAKHGPSSLRAGCFRKNVSPKLNADSDNRSFIPLPIPFHLLAPSFPDFTVAKHKVEQDTTGCQNITFDSEERGQVDKTLSVSKETQIPYFNRLNPPGLDQMKNIVYFRNLFECLVRDKVLRNRERFSEINSKILKWSCKGNCKISDEEPAETYSALTYSENPLWNKLQNEVSLIFERMLCLVQLCKGRNNGPTDDQLAEISVRSVLVNENQYNCFLDDVPTFLLNLSTPSMHYFLHYIRTLIKIFQHLNVSIFLEIRDRGQSLEKSRKCIQNGHEKEDKILQEKKDSALNDDRKDLSHIKDEEDQKRNKKNTRKKNPLSFIGGLG